MMLYIDEKLYELLKRKALASRPPTKPGPMAAEIVRQYFEKGEKSHAD